MSPAVVRWVRLCTGLVLLGYLTTHFANHALGILSLDAMEAGREWFLLLWRNPVGTLALYGSLLAHLGLALWALYQRRHLRMPAWEAAQLALGLAVPALLAAHVVGTRLAFERFHVTDSYERVVWTLWVASPWRGARQAALLVLAWVHGCMGIHFWLRFRPRYQGATPALYAVALLLPALGLLGFAQAGRQMAATAAYPREGAVVGRPAGAVDPAERDVLARSESALAAAYGGAIALVLLARAARGLYYRRWHAVRIGYPGGRTVTAPAGTSVLEASRLAGAGIPHASVCGGRGRCSTCRVRVVGGLDALPPPAEAERRVLRRVGAAPDVRLACQTRPRGNVAVVPLLPADISAREALGSPDRRQGDEREIAVLFADLRGFTRLAERKLPYDVVFFLNRYFEAVGSAITGAGGIVNQFTGDGVMALFGVEAGPQAGCRQALEAARGMVDRVAGLARDLGGEVEGPLRLGIGIHAGPAVVGRIGYGETFYLTAVGDTVHVAARLEQLTKEYGCDLVISEQVAAHGGLDVGGFPRHEVAVRNRRDPVIVRVVDRVAQLAAAAPGRDNG
jgi:adenylate cyclase